MPRFVPRTVEVADSLLPLEDIHRMGADLARSDASCKGRDIHEIGAAAFTSTTPSFVSASGSRDARWWFAGVDGT